MDAEGLRIHEEPLRIGGCGLSEQGRFVVTLLLEELVSISKRVKAVEVQLEQLTIGDSVVKWQLAIKGVGPVTAWTMRALIGRFDRFATGKQLARYCTPTPRNASNGQRVADSGLVAKRATRSSRAC